MVDFVKPVASRRVSVTGYIFEIAAAVLWAISGTSAKFLFHRDVTPWQLVQLRITLAAVTLFLWLIFKNPKLLRIDKRDWMYFIILGAGATAGVQFTYLYAISKINGAAAILLEYLSPSLIVLYSLFIVREKPAKITIIALIGATAGCYLVVGAYNFDIFAMNLAGILGGLGAAVTFSWYSIQGEYGMRKYNPWTVLFYAFGIGAVAINIAVFSPDAFMRSYAPVEWVWIVYISVIGTILPFGFYYEGINRIRSSRASITATLEPIIAGVVSYIFLGEVMEIPQIAGGVLVIFSVVILQLRQQVDENAPFLIRKKSKWTPGNG